MARCQECANCRNVLDFRDLHKSKRDTKKVKIEGARAGGPDTYFESPCSDDATVEQYQKIVLECSRLAETTSSPDAKVEAPGMIKKMRALLDPKLRREVDFEEATQGCSNTLAEWSKGNCAGTRAFMPGTVD